MARGVVSAGGGPDGFMAKYAGRAMEYTGLTDETLRHVWGSEMISDVTLTATGGAGTPLIAGSGPGLAIINPGAGTTGQGGRVVMPGYQSEFSIASIAQKRWYFVGVYKIGSTLPNANTRFAISFGNVPSYHVAVGINGVTQTAKYAFCINTVDASGLFPKLDVLSTVSPQVGTTVVVEVWNTLQYAKGKVNNENAVTIGLSSSLTDGVAGVFGAISLPAGNGQADTPQVDRLELWAES